MLYDVTAPYCGVKSPYLLSGDRLSYHSILALMSKIKKEGYKNISIEENLIHNFSYRVAFDKIGALKHLDRGDEVKLNTGMKLNPKELSKYKYSFFAKPDFDKLREDYNNYIADYSEDEKAQLAPYALDLLSGMNNFYELRNVIGEFYRLSSVSKMILDDKILGMQYWIDGFNVVKNTTNIARHRKICDEFIDRLSSGLVNIMFLPEANS